MRQALLILRKDVRHFWPQIAVFWAMLAGHTYLDAATPGNPNIALNITMPALALVGACFYLIGTLVHEDALIGDKQFWLTRPFDWSGLLTAKVLFAVVFMVMPVLVAQLITTTVSGLPVFASLAALAPGSVKPLLLVVIAVAFAAVTRNLTHFFLALLAASITQLVLLAFLFDRAYEYADWGSMEWIRIASTALPVLSGIVALVHLMYRRHSAILARCILAALALLVPTSRCLHWWYAAWSFQTRLYANSATAPSVSIRYDRSAPPFPQGLWYPFLRENLVNLKIPVQTTGIPEGMQLIGERLRTQVNLPDGRSWDSGWRAMSGIGELGGGRRLVRHDGADALALIIDASFFDMAKDVPAGIHARLAFAVLGKPETTYLPAGVLAQRVSSDCLCSVPARFNYSAWCFSTDGGAAHREVHWDWPSTAAPTGGVLYSFAIIDPLSAWRHTNNPSSHPGRATRTATLLTRRVENYIEISLDIPEIRLAAYEVGRARGRRLPGEGLRNEP
jgi:hypothetical protein